MCALEISGMSTCHCSLLTKYLTKIVLPNELNTTAL